MSSRHGTVRDHAASPTRPRRCRTMRDLGCSVSRDVPNGHHSSVHVSRRSRLEPNGHNVPTVPRRFPDGPGRSSGPQRDQAVFAKIANPCGTFSTKSCVCPSVPHGPAWSHVLPRGASVGPNVSHIFFNFSNGPDWSQLVPVDPKFSHSVPTGPDSPKRCSRSRQCPNGPKQSQWSRQVVPNGAKWSPTVTILPNGPQRIGTVWSCLGTVCDHWDL